MDVALEDPENPVIWATQANWKALGFDQNNFVPASGDTKNQWNSIDATITFNPDYFPDKNPGSDDRDFRKRCLEHDRRTFDHT